MGFLERLSAQGRELTFGLETSRTILPPIMLRLHVHVPAAGAQGLRAHTVVFSLPPRSYVSCLSFFLVRINVLRP